MSEAVDRAADALLLAIYQCGRPEIALCNLKRPLIASSYRSLVAKHLEEQGYVVLEKKRRGTNDGKTWSSQSYVFFVKLTDAGRERAAKLESEIKT